MAGMLSLAFAERDPKQIVRKAARLIDPSSPYRQALDQTISLAERALPFPEIAAAIQARWSAKYQTTNSAVINGALTALAIWFGDGDFSKTVEPRSSGRRLHRYRLQCRHRRGRRGRDAWHDEPFPGPLVAQLSDRMRGEELAGVRITPPLDESVIGIARRTAAIGEKFILANGGSASGRDLRISPQAPVSLPPELFPVSALMNVLGLGLGTRRRRPRK